MLDKDYSFPVQDNESNEENINIECNCGLPPHSPHNPGCPPHKPHSPALTMQEEFLRTIKRVNDTLHRVYCLEENTKRTLDDLSRQLTADNVEFKNLAISTYNEFSNAVRTEINSFETLMNNSFSAFEECIKNENENHILAYNDFQKNVNDEITRFETTISENFDTFKKDINTSYKTFTGNVNNVIEKEFSEQNAKITTAENYMKTNLKINVNDVITEMYNSGQLGALINETILNDKISRSEVASTYATKEGLATTQARIDNLVGGNTPEGSEITDLRIDYNGTTHATAGESVRAQFSAINNDVSSITRDNLLDFTKLEIGYYTNEGKYEARGNLVNKSNTVTSHYIAIDPSNTYYFQYWQTGINIGASNEVAPWLGFTYFDENFTFIKRVTSASSDSYKTIKLAPPSNAKYVRVSFRTIFGGKWKLEKSNYPTAYCHEKENAENILEELGYFSGVYIDSAGNCVAEYDTTKTFTAIAKSVYQGEKFTYGATYSSNPWIAVAYYDETYTFISRTTAQVQQIDEVFRTKIDIEVPENAVYMIVTGRLSNLIDIELTKTGEEFNAKKQAMKSANDVEGLINAIGGEKFEFQYSEVYPDTTTFEWEPAESGEYAISNISEGVGGLLCVSFDENIACTTAFNIYLFDKAGNPYKLTGLQDNFTKYGKGYKGNFYEPTFATPPGLGSYGSLLGNFTCIIPEGCRVMLATKMYNTWTGEKPSGKLLECSSIANAYSQWVVNGGLHCYLLPFTKTETTATETKINKSFVKGIAHRGFSSEAPENTIPAFELASEKGFKYVECDVQFTVDNIPVVLHDSTIDRTSDGTGDITSLSFEEVRAFDFGSWKNVKYAGVQIPSFEEVVSVCRNRGLHLYIELKGGTITDTQIDTLLNILKKYSMLENVSWISFDGNKLLKVVNKYPRARCGICLNTLSENSVSWVVDLKTGENEVFADATYTQVNDATAQYCIDGNIGLEVWTVDNADKVRSLHPYVTGVTTNTLIIEDVLNS